MSDRIVRGQEGNATLEVRITGNNSVTVKVDLNHDNIPDIVLDADRSGPGFLAVNQSGAGPDGGNINSFGKLLADAGFQAAENSVNGRMNAQDASNIMRYVTGMTPMPVSMTQLSGTPRTR